jgi:deoxyadenosine/deoxycytidine kinase
MHRFDRPEGTKYPNNYTDRYTNYIIGFNELGLNTDEVDEHFKSVIQKDKMIEIHAKWSKSDQT